MLLGVPLGLWRFIKFTRLEKSDIKKTNDAKIHNLSYIACSFVYAYLPNERRGHHQVSHLVQALPHRVNVANVAVFQNGVHVVFRVFHAGTFEGVACSSDGGSAVHLGLVDELKGGDDGDDDKYMLVANE